MKYVHFSKNFQVKITNISPPPYETVPLGVDNFAYEYLTVGILRDEELEFVTIRKLWLPQKTRINEFRWALKSTRLGEPSWRVKLNRWCQFWYSFNTYELWDPRSKKPLRLIHTDETLNDLLIEHTKGPRRVFFFVEELKTQPQWRPKKQVPYRQNTLETNMDTSNSLKKTDEEKIQMTVSSWDHNNNNAKCQQEEMLESFVSQCSSSTLQGFPCVVPFVYPVVVPIYVPVYTFYENFESLGPARYGEATRDS
ncbi:hypothetical protein GpartN1_g667.t1 [Galdieria partita]|uniref:Uncharacterized protein n=1 Tax=Galdieria partita TaxID=83374 RepID=A0A9C7UN07_9RHOD|nr:hypothetical protein GpartN1_g667.t1 [Galdieria partita]